MAESSSGFRRARRLAHGLATNELPANCSAHADQIALHHAGIVTGQVKAVLPHRGEIFVMTENAAVGLDEEIGDWAAAGQVGWLCSGHQPGPGRDQLFRREIFHRKFPQVFGRKQESQITPPFFANDGHAFDAGIIGVLK